MFLSSFLVLQYNQEGESMDKELLIERITERCGLTRLEALQKIEASQWNGKLKELLIIAGMVDNKNV